MSTRRSRQGSQPLRVQLTFHRQSHPQIVDLLAPLTPWQRRDRIVSLLYHGIGAELSMLAPEQPRKQSVQPAYEQGTAAPSVRPPVERGARPQIARTEPAPQQPATVLEEAADDGLWRPQVEGDVFEELGIPRPNT